MVCSQYVAAFVHHLWRQSQLAAFSGGNPVRCLKHPVATLQTNSALSGCVPVALSKVANDHWRVGVVSHFHNDWATDSLMGAKRAVKWRKKGASYVICRPRTSWRRRQTSRMTSTT